jgi:hypothetical protein
MTRRRAVIVLVCLLTSSADRSFAGPVGTHAVRGIVKSVTTSTLVIVRSGRKPVDMTFALNASTQHEGTLNAGVTVSIRYVTNGRTLIATGVSAQPE